MDKATFSTIFHSANKVSKNESLNLSILISQNSLMFALFTTDYKYCIELGHVQFKNAIKSDDDLTDQLEMILTNFQLKNRNYNKISFTVLTQDFTLIPDAFAEKSDAKSLLAFTTGNTENKTVKHHKLNGLDFIFSLKMPLVSAVESAFQSVSLKHAGAVAINLSFSHHSLLNVDLFLNIHDSEIEITLKDKNTLQFFNSFRFENDEDILYYLLFTMEQFGLNPLQVKLGVAGQIEANGELTKTLKRYIKNVQFCAFDPSFQLDKELASLPNHYYFTLLNQHLCEL